MDKGIHICTWTHETNKAVTIHLANVDSLVNANEGWDDIVTTPFAFEPGCDVQFINAANKMKILDTMSAAGIHYRISKMLVHDGD